MQQPSLLIVHQTKDTPDQNAINISLFLSFLFPDKGFEVSPHMQAFESCRTPDRVLQRDHERRARTKFMGWIHLKARGTEFHRIACMQCIRSHVVPDATLSSSAGISINGSYVSNANTWLRGPSRPTSAEDSRPLVDILEFLKKRRIPVRNTTTKVNFLVRYYGMEARSGACGIEARLSRSWRLLTSPFRWFQIQYT